MTVQFADLFTNTERPALTVVPTAPLIEPDAEHARRYALTALTRENQTLAATREGERNHTLNTAAFNCAQLLGHITEEEIRNTLGDTAAHIGLNHTEIRATLTSAIRSGSQHPRTIPPPLHEPNVTELVIGDEFWDTRPTLAHIRDFALARMCSPWAVLGGCLLRASAAIPHFVVLPPIVGGVGSLNLLVASVGPSGSGKGAAEAAARDAFMWPHVESFPLGSGEGITHAYASPKRRKDDDPDPETLIWHHRSVLFTSAEIDQVTAISQRRGATLMPQLRSAYSGERLGMHYVDVTKKIILPDHSYRFGLSVGVQPGRARALLMDSDGGTPQRFLWLPTTDPRITATPEAQPEPWRWSPPIFDPKLTPSVRTDSHGFIIVPVPPSVEQVVREARAARGRGEGDALDGHALFTRLKVAQHLAGLDQRPVMTEADWALAGIVMRQSDLTRGRIEAELSKQLEIEDNQRAKRDAQRQHITETELEKKAVQRVRRGLAVKIQAANSMTKNEARKTLASRDRRYLDAALEWLVDADHISVESTDSGEVLTWL